MRNNSGNLIDKAKTANTKIMTCTPTMPTPQVRKSAAPFGGIQLVLCGDFLQLPPVGVGKRGKKFAFETEAWEACGLADESKIMCLHTPPLPNPYSRPY